MELNHLIGGFITLALMAYLFVALLKPEWMN